ncbi:MAG TPA: SH3 domain-containing protein [Tepidisphaeraceae bacterium]|jgi:uncharacterized protein YgiM (DUF1202 family)
MTARHFLSAFTVSLATFAAVVAPMNIARAEDATAVPEVANGKRPLVGKITATVYVRSGPGDSYYPTTKLEPGAEVTVVGEKFDWLKITPPAGSYSYVAKAYIDKNADGTGTVNKDEVNVRAGSTLNGLKTSIQSKLAKGATVQISDEKEDYYLIKPPADAYVYVAKQYVEPIREAAPQIAGANGTAVPGAGAPEPVAGTPDQAIAESANKNAIGTTGFAGPAGPYEPGVKTPSTAPSTEHAIADGATTQPSIEVTFNKLEADFSSASAKSIDEQPVTELLSQYKKMLADNSLPESMKRVADFRVRTLTARAQAKEQFAQVQKLQEESKKRQQALKAEQEEIAQTIKKNNVTLYAAVGTLRTSSFQNDKTTLYRLTDPDTGRTVVYLRTNDTKYAQLIGKFIGVKGEIATESALSMKVINPTDAAEIQQSELFKSIGAQIVPPSILPQTAQQASAGNQ